jgi:hypothetical protein
MNGTVEEKKRIRGSMGMTSHARASAGDETMNVPQSAEFHSVNNGRGQVLPVQDFA